MEAYLLPNEARIDIDGVVDAMLAADEYPQRYLDMETGTLKRVASREALGRWVSEIGAAGKRYILVPYIEDDERNEIARDFIDIIVATMAAERLPDCREALARRGWKRLAQFLKEETDGLIHAWDQFVSDEAWARARHWLLADDSPVPIREVFEGCEGCAICELMRKDEDGDVRKLSEAFALENTVALAGARTGSARNGRNAAPRGWYPVKRAGTRIAKGGPKSKKCGAPGGGAVRNGEGTAFRFKITLDGSTPKIWRRILVPKECSFFELHCAIQDAMGWADSHLHAFRIGPRDQKRSARRNARDDMITIESPGPSADDWRPPGEYRDERAAYIADYFGGAIKQCAYEYDFGDGWIHTVLFEREVPRDPGATYPQCVAGGNACPPEDCGGVWGYARMQEILRDPEHEEYDDMLDWLCIEDPGMFDPARFDPAAVVFADPADRLRRYER